VDRSSHSVVRDMNKCVLCRRCVRTCIDLQEVGVLEVAHRGAESKVVTYEDRPLADVVCINCGQCINRCPTGALQANDVTDEVWAAIDDPSKHVVIQTAPSPRAGIGECFGCPPGTPLTFETNTALRRCGFDKVFDTNFSADLTILEEGTELLLAFAPGARARSARPAAAVHELLTRVGEVHRALLSRTPGQYVVGKSPQQMFGALIKTFYAPAQRDRPQGHRQRRAHAVLGEEVRVQPSGDVSRRGARTWTSV